jgi:hypothetical protein
MLPHVKSPFFLFQSPFFWVTTQFQRGAPVGRGALRQGFSAAQLFPAELLSEPENRRCALTAVL